MAFQSVYGAGMRTSVQMPLNVRMPQSDRSDAVERQLADARVLQQRALLLRRRIERDQIAVGGVVGGVEQRVRAGS